jgi:kumamolisin
VNNQFSDGRRQTPDVAADADPLTGYRIYYSDNSCSGNDCWTVVGGTSAAAPFWAGIIALANQQGNRKLGFLNPALYAIGATSASGGLAAFHDVTGGGNLYYQAAPGWDYSTGWGSPDAAVLVPALLGQ